MVKKILPASEKKRAASQAMAANPARKKSSQTASSLIDDQLARYRSMRNFAITSEPKGTANAKKNLASLPFVIQKHAASHLHYDFRLGWNGVLKSWAVAKGPSYFPGDKRLAVEVEDHPLEYGGFEGIIPKDQYGGGTVMVWDQGTWEPLVDVDDGLKNGNLKFHLHGAKLHGKWALVRMKKSWGEKPNWLLIKEKDHFARNEKDTCVTQAEPDSVVTKRSLDEIAAAETHVWNSDRTRSPGKPWRHGNADKRSEPDEQVSVPLPETPKKLLKRLEITTKALVKEKLPQFIPVQLATTADSPPLNQGWLYELKLDGYRVEARKQGDSVRLFTRSGLDWTHRMPQVAEAIRRITATNGILDGEVVVLDAKGNSSFASLQASFEHGEHHPFHYFVFDLLHYEGLNTRALPLVKRKEILRSILPNQDDVIQYCSHIEGQARGDQIFHNACSLQAEGVIAKRVDAPYSSGRNNSWLKLKCVREQEFVIGGFTSPRNGTHGIGSLLLGYYEDKKLVYAGRTGTGFNQRMHRTLRDKLDSLQTKTSPFASMKSEAARDVTWVFPKLVAQIHFATWTDQHLLRQAAFLGLREDKNASEIVREDMDAPPTPRVARRRNRHILPHDESSSMALTQSKDSASLQIPVRLTHPEKELDATSGLTKRELAEYYWAVADSMLPHIVNRPLSIVRCPEGSGKPCFFQKHVNRTLPSNIKTVMISTNSAKKPEPYITLDSKEALAGLAQLGVLELHPWASTNDALERPDRIIIDLDPDESITWKQLSKSAKEIHDSLQSICLKSFLKSTGGKGLHIVIPIAPQYEWSTVKQWSKAFATAIEASQPDLYLTKMSKAARRDKIFIDYLRNERGATAVAAFSPRARKGVCVSMPLRWSELKDDMRNKFSVHNFHEWKARLASDPWDGIEALRQQLPGFSDAEKLPRTK